MAKHDKLDTVLNHPHMTDIEWRTFAKLLGIQGLKECGLEKRRTIVNEELRHSYGHSVANAFRDEFKPDYSEILIGVAKKLKVGEIPSITSEHSINIEELENKILIRVMEMVKEDIIKKDGQEGLKKWEEKFKEDFEEGFREGRYSEEDYNYFKKYGFWGLFATLIAGKMSGFWIYMIANQAFFAVSRFFGLGIGVAAAGSIIGKGLAAFLGPVGWGIAGAWVIKDLGDTNWKKVIPTIVFAISLRRRFRLPALPAPQES
jgi:Uncharacterized protein conserved in bacteria